MLPPHQFCLKLKASQISGDRGYAPLLTQRYFCNSQCGSRRRRVCDALWSMALQAHRNWGTTARAETV